MNKLTKYEQETTINYNREEKVAYIYTCDASLQRHLEGKLRLKSVKDNGFGGKEYVIDKKCIRKPMFKRLVSEDTRKAQAERLAVMRSGDKISGRVA